MTTTKSLDYLVYGATGFVGRRVAALLRQRTKTASIGLAGRGREKLEAVADEVDGDVEVLVADSSAPDTVDRAVASARVVLNCAGPFTKYGTPVVEACVRHGTHYVDITGETPWVRGLIEAHHDTARRDGTVLVPFSGYDSVPSDLGVFLAVEALREAHDEPARRVVGAQGGKGGFNGGTLQTLLLLSRDSEALRDASRRYALSPGDFPKVRNAPGDRFGPQRDLDGVWRPPFFMAMVNTRVVRRSEGLFEEVGAPYGDNTGFEYVEMMDLGRRSAVMKAVVGSAVTTAGFAAAAFAPTRALLSRLDVVKPGAGPTEASIEDGACWGTWTSESSSGQRARVRFKASGDPGNAATASFLVESARCLLEDGAGLGVGEPGRGGILTPAFAFGHRLVDRLRAVGMTFEVS